ncbi:unnamed protein product [Polarella glacialis]|uniref:Cytochrome b5 heme-binding domain-containing protein n=1 Tax=Polarella glacialis TaxID=89957 RepID=A0A813HSL5_POLGL|nr:unnamed protein product [Polarella glacialis]
MDYYLAHHWTIIHERAYSIEEFIPSHPGGPLIWRCVGEDATELFDAHHSSKVARAVLERYEIGHIAQVQSKTGPFRTELNRRAAKYLKAPTLPVAEAIACGMLVMFVLWASLAYIGGWMALNVALSWFWSRHLDAGLHGAVHGDFSYSKVMHKRLLQTYSLLSHHMLDYYQGGNDGKGLSQHYQHHLFTNDILRDPDMTDFAGDRNWIRRHPCNPWQEYNEWQGLYWLAALCILEPVTELLTMIAACVMGALQLMEPPADAAIFKAR